MRLMHTLLELYPTVNAPLLPDLQHPHELFSGYYALQVMLLMISRK
jgi:hypothetical protein